VVFGFVDVMTGTGEPRTRSGTTEKEERGTVTRDHEDTRHSIEGGLTVTLS
jgi:hypothetical protein